MKKFLVIALTLIISYSQAFAETELTEMPKLKFNKNSYTLLYSAKNSEMNSYINEYYKKDETYTKWTELLTVHYFPNSFSPIEQANSLRDLLGEELCPSAIIIDEENNTAILDFILVQSNRRPVVLEFNVFKFEKSSICGTKAIQYAKRYILTNPVESELLKREFRKNRLKYIKKVSKFETPEAIKESIDKGVLIEQEKTIEEKPVQEETTKEEAKTEIKDTKGEELPTNIKQNEPENIEEKIEEKAESNVQGVQNKDEVINESIIEEKAEKEKEKETKTEAKEVIEENTITETEETKQEEKIKTEIFKPSEEAIVDYEEVYTPSQNIDYDSIYNDNEETNNNEIKAEVNNNKENFEEIDNFDYDFIEENEELVNIEEYLFEEEEYEFEDIENIEETEKLSNIISIDEYFDLD